MRLGAALALRAGELLPADLGGIVSLSSVGELKSAESVDDEEDGG